MTPDGKPATPASIGSLDTAVDSLSQRMHAEVTRQIRSAFDELLAASIAERDRAAAEARASAESAAASELAAAVAAATEQTRAVEAKTSIAVDAAYMAGVAKGLADGREQAIAESREETTRAVREALAGAEQTTHMAVEAAESAARVRLAALEQSTRQHIEAVERDARRDVDAAKEQHRSALEDIEAASRNQLEAAEESARQRLKDADALAREQLQAAEAEARHRLEVAVAATTAARADLRSSGSSDGASGERLLDAIRAIDRARSLSEILDTLASCAGREAKAAAVFLVRGRRFRGWRAIGFGSVDGAAASIDVPFDAAGILGKATDSNTIVNSGPAPAFAPDAKHPVAIPIAISGSVVAVLYADQATDPTAGGPVPRSQALEAIARHAARALESLTAFKTARALASGDAQAVRAAGDAGDDDVAAKRYARLLISEIRLYHEAAVAAGRRDRDLTTRLGGEIARARVLYEQRVPAHIRQRADHFRDELVRTLADGDAALVDARA